MRSLRWRLTAWVAGVLLVAAAIVFTVVYVSTGAQIRGQINRNLAAQSSQLSQALSPVAGEGPPVLASHAEAYLRALPYSVNSNLLFVILPGGGIVSNHLELFTATQPEASETAAEQRVENLAVARLRRPRRGYADAEVPDVGRVRLFERALPGSRPAVVIAAGQPLSRVEQAQHGVAGAFVLAGALTLLLALLASYLAGARVSAPLRRMASVARRVDAGDLAPRMTADGRSGAEVTILAEAFNHMLDRLQQAFASQHEFIADASHELRTPLTVMRGQLELLASKTSPEAVRRVEGLLQAEITRVTRLVDDLLLLAQADQRSFLQREPVDLRAFVTELWDGLSLTANRGFQLGEVPDGVLLADPDRLAQALRNLGRNAIEHTDPGSGVVRLEVARSGGREIVFTVLDDGPGVPSEERERVFDRFHRTDPARSRSTGGAGLGLAIVRAIAEAHGGGVRAVGRDGQPGARFELRLPGFSVAVPRPAQSVS